METTIVKAFELVMILCKKFNIDESHSLKHSMEVYNFALRIYESELPMNAYLEEQKDIIVLAAILHDTIDKKYVAEADGIEEIRLADPQGIVGFNAGRDRDHVGSRHFRGRGGPGVRQDYWNPDKVSVRNNHG